MSSLRPNSIHIAAGGHGTRAREAMIELGFPGDLPKHLLPTGASNNETLLGRIVQQALEAPIDGPVIIYANEHNEGHFAAHPDIGPHTNIVTKNLDNSLSPFVDNLLAEETRTVGCAGDFYADFSWHDFLAHHDSTPFPVTFMAGQTVEVEGGAVYDIADTGQITKLRRAERTDQTEFINIGAYIFDPEKAVLDVLARLTKTARQAGERLKEDTVAHALVDSGLVGAYILPTKPFNVNTGATYQALRDHTALKAAI